MDQFEKKTDRLKFACSDALDSLVHAHKFNTFTAVYFHEFGKENKSDLPKIEVILEFSLRTKSCMT